MQEPTLTTVAEFDAYLLELNNQKDALAEKINGIRKERDLVFAKETVKTRVANMSESEREAMRQALAAAETPAPVNAEPQPADQTINVHGVESTNQVSNV